MLAMIVWLARKNGIDNAGNARAFRSSPVSSDAIFSAFRASVVHDDRFFSGDGATSGVDFGLAEIFGEMTAQVRRQLIEYAPQPPFGAGRPETASPEIFAALDAMFGDA